MSVCVWRERKKLKEREVSELWETISFVLHHLISFVFLLLSSPQYPTCELRRRVFDRLSQFSILEICTHEEGPGEKSGGVHHVQRLPPPQETYIRASFLHSSHSIPATATNVSFHSLRVATTIHRPVPSRRHLLQQH